MLCSYYSKGLSSNHKNTHWCYLFSQYPIENSKKNIQKYSRFVEEFHNDLWCRNVTSFMLKYTKYHKYLLHRHINYIHTKTTILKLGRIWRSLSSDSKNEWIRLYRKESRIKYCISKYQVIPAIKIIIWWKRRRSVLVKKRLNMLCNYIPVDDVCEIINSYAYRTHTTPIEQLHNILNKHLDGKSVQIVISYF